MPVKYHSFSDTLKNTEDIKRKASSETMQGTTTLWHDEKLDYALAASCDIS
jgi:hypothetical protein